MSTYEERSLKVGQVYKRTTGSIGDKIDTGDIGVLIETKVDAGCRRYLMLSGSRCGENLLLDSRLFKMIYPPEEKATLNYKGKSVELSDESFEAIKKMIED